ncbi:MAG: type II secretion system F family protein, partial [Actinomycetota bacterium]
RFDLAGDGARTVVVSVAVDGSVATARVVIDGPSGTPPGDDENDDRGGAAGVPTGPSDPSPSVVVASTGFWSDARLLPIGLGAVFASLFVVGLLAARPAARIRLEAASSADRLAGFHTRLGNAVDRLVSRHALGRRLDLQLDAANISLRAGEFVIGWVAIAIPLALVLAATGRPLVGLLVLVVLVAATVGTLRVRAERRRTRFADQLTDTLAILASSLRAGQSLPRSVELVATESPAPTGPEFHRIAFEVRVGRDLTESMRDAADRLQSPDLAWLAQAVDINRELGGDLTQILDNVAGTIRERRTVARQIEALSAEGRATGWMLEGMPVVLFFFSWWRTPQHIDRLLNETAGRILLGIALSGMVIGHLWIRRLVRLRY